MKNIIIIILLLGLNIAMGILLFKRNFQLSNLSTELIKQSEDIIVLNHNLEKCYTSFVTVNNKSIRLFLVSAGISTDVEQPQNYQSLLVLIPPYPCDVCLDNEVENINKLCKEKGCNIVLITPEFRIRNLRIMLNNNPAIKFIKYDIDAVTGQKIADLDAVIYFRTTTDAVYDVFIPNSYYKRYSELYLSNFK